MRAVITETYEPAVDVDNEDIWLDHHGYVDWLPAGSEPPCDGWQRLYVRRIEATDEEPTVRDLAAALDTILPPRVPCVLDEHGACGAVDEHVRTWRTTAAHLTDKAAP
jgi:hypothetical protein